MPVPASNMNHPSPRLRIGVLYGGRSSEHEVSLMSATNVVRALRPERYEVVPIFVSRDGRWLLGGFDGGALATPSVGSELCLVSGGRGRLSSLTAGVFLLILLSLLSPFVAQIPMPALVAVMIMVSIGTFSWNSIPNLRRHPWQSSVVMVMTVVVVVATHDLSLGVAAGVLLSGIFFAQKVQRLFRIERELSEDGQTATYRISGEIFFASAHRFTEQMQTDKETAPNVVIDMTHAHLWDISSVAALDKIVGKLDKGGASVKVIGYNEASADIVDKFALHDKTGFELGTVPH